MRLDGSKNFASLTQDAAPTKNFCFDSHWQQSHSVHSSYISEKRRAGSIDMPPHRQRKCVGCESVEKVGRVHKKIHGLLMAMRPAMELR